MDELTKRADEMEGWEKLARALDAELNRIKAKQKNRNLDRSKKTYHELTEQDLLNDPLFPWRGNGISIDQYIESNREKLEKVYGLRSDGTYCNKISNIRLRYPAKIQKRGKTRVQLNAELRALGEALAK